MFDFANQGRRKELPEALCHELGRLPQTTYVPDTGKEMEHLSPKRANKIVVTDQLRKQHEDTNLTKSSKKSKHS